VFARPAVVAAVAPVAAAEAVEFVAPYFVELLRDIKVSVGQDVCFKCKVAGMPAPEVRWYKDGVLVAESAKIRVISVGLFL